MSRFAMRTGGPRPVRTAVRPERTRAAKILRPARSGEPIGLNSFANHGSKRAYPICQAHGRTKLERQRADNYRGLLLQSSHFDLNYLSNDTRGIEH
jgi:hypothetical protein